MATSSESVSGTDGYVNIGSSDVCQLTGWDATIENAILTTNVHCSAPWQTTQRGTKKVSGTLKANWARGARLESMANTDTVVALELLMTTGYKWSGNARLGAISHSVSLANSLQTVTVAFESDGTWALT